MIVNQLFTAFLIPSIISSENGTTSRTPISSEEFGDTWKAFPDIFNSSSSVSPPKGVDPLLDAVNEDVARLGLDYPDDYLDHLEDKSEEIRELIARRRQTLDVEGRRTSTSATPTVNTTQFPILNPPTQVEIETTTKKGSVIGSAISGVKNEAGSFFGRIVNPISNAGRSLFGRKTTTTTTTTPPPPEELTTDEIVTKNCTKVFQIFFQGDCRNLLQNQFCPSPTQWLVEDPVSLRAKCVENPCHAQPNKASFGGSCIAIGGHKECQAGMRTFIYRSGVVECDCVSDPPHLFNVEDGKCYEAYKRGPCTTGQHFKLSQAIGGKPVCSSNPCVNEEYFCNAPRCVKQRNCERIGASCGIINGMPAQYIVSPLTFTPTCSPAPQPIIGNVPTLSCAPGSRRDILGNCRTPTTIDFS